MNAPLKPSVSPARAAAFDILLRVEQHGSYASELLHAQEAARLSAADHGLATELVMGVLRWRGLLDRTIDEFSSQRSGRLDLEVLTALRLGTYQIRFLERIPARAAINESVELVKRARKRSATGLVNAVLRKIASQPSSLLQATAEFHHCADAAALARAGSHPQWLVERWTESYGIETAGQICSYDQQRPETAIRLHAPEAEDELKEEKIQLAPGHLLGAARRVLSGDVSRSRAFRTGKVAIQDEASQLVALLVGRGRKILDCCAAPGGKTSILAENNSDAEVIAVELHPHRARLLRKLVNAPNVRVVAGDARSMPVAADFDRILADVPCSGTGTLARNPDIKWRLKPEDLSDLQRRQIAIVTAAATVLAPGGRLVYSTCSLETEENSDVVERILATVPQLRLIKASVELERLRTERQVTVDNINSIQDGPYLRTIPGVHDCDGFFAAILEKS